MCIHIFEKLPKSSTFFTMSSFEWICPIFVKNYFCSLLMGKLFLCRDLPPFSKIGFLFALQFTNTYELLVHWKHVRLSQSVTLLPRISRVWTIGLSRRGVSCLVQYLGAKDHVLETWSTKSSNGVRICRAWHTESIQTRDVSPFACPKFGCVLDLSIILIVQWEIVIWMFIFTCLIFPLCISWF